MRVIEPHQLTKQKSQKTKKRLLFPAGAVILLGFVVIALGYINQGSFGIPQVLGESRDTDNQEVTLRDEDYRYFAPPEFQQLYSQFVYPNTKMLILPPKITGDSAADNRIRTIALSRGFRLASLPVAPIRKVEVAPGLEDNLLQDKALAAWTELSEAAQEANVPLSFASGYRSIELQRQLFLGQLKTHGLMPGQISGGRVDNQLVGILKTTAIPGYSHHHTGYTIDVVCKDGKIPFQATSCYQWLSRDNYLQAKKTGWIPSFPEGTSDNSPEPEPAEYVWIGRQALLKEQR